MGNLVGRLAGHSRLRRALQTRGELASIRSAQQAYAALNWHWRRGDDVLVDARWPVARSDSEWANVESFERHMMHVDAATYLPDDILVKVDRASMAVGLEARVPIIDHRVVEFAATLPIEWNVKDGTGKRVLRRVLDRYVPRALVDRPKIGFGVPIDDWLRGPLRDWAESLLDARRLKREGFFHPQPIRARWEEHLSGRAKWHYHLWDVLMFQAWREHWHP